MTDRELLEEVLAVANRADLHLTDPRKALAMIKTILIDGGVRDHAARALLEAVREDTVN